MKQAGPADLVSLCHTLVLALNFLYIASSSPKQPSFTGIGSGRIGQTRSRTLGPSCTRVSLDIGSGPCRCQRHHNQDANRSPSPHPLPDRNCEDILLSTLIFHHTHLPHILFDGQFHDTGASRANQGISEQPGHYGLRTTCCKMFVDRLGRDSMVTSGLLVKRG
ncbi:hypothetical protein BCR39DRAFT_513204 [Naematelia encephala]|uniref:Glycosyl transferase 64 domain-containing protein n=1 Tax=Naematelia encephala TaxID=71784 RepID=A0A1Y2BP55_9TREE|nr:hypothetical protein BCR39DRAFT_513204 [Naematelia encephala]